DREHRPLHVEIHQVPPLLEHRQTHEVPVELERPLEVRHEDHGIAQAHNDLQAISGSYRNCAAVISARKNSPSTAKRSDPKCQPIRSRVGIVIPANVASSSMIPPNGWY